MNKVLAFLIIIAYVLGTIGGFGYVLFMEVTGLLLLQ